jgi:hypothetical protein
MSTFKALDTHGGREVRVTVKIFGSSTKDPCVVLHVGPVEVLTTDPEGFFEQVAQAKAKWEESQQS